MSSKFFWKSLLVAPAVLGAALVSSAAFAQTAPEASAASNSQMATLDQVMQYSNEGSGAGSLAQVTSVTQFSDVSPSDWAYEALSFLANSEDLGGLDCLEGYPDGSYRGSRALTRYEFAAGLAACLDAVSGRGLNVEQLDRIEALQREFAAELAALRGRVDALEAAVDELEANQFSTTTRLRGEAIIAAADLFGGENANIGSDNNLFVGSRLRLNLITSFTGDDLLYTRLQASAIPGFNSPDGGPLPDGFTSDFTSLAFGGSNGNDVELNDFYYQFPLGPVGVTVGLNSTGISDIVTDVSPFSSSGQGGVGFFSYNPIYDLGAQQQALALTFDIGDSFQLGTGYLTGNAPDPSPGEALFNGDSTIFGQLTYASDSATVALTYVNAYVGDSELSGFAGPTVFNAYGVSANVVLGDVFNIGGWVTYVDGRTFDTSPTVGDGRYWTYAATLGVDDLAIDGSLLGLIVGVPPYEAIYELANGNARGGDTSFYAEGFYRIPVSENISITPAVIFLTDPSNDNNNDAVVIGAVRTTFSF